MENLNSLTVFVAYALPSVQEEVTLQLPLDACVEDALIASGLLARFKLNIEQIKVGIWGEKTSLDIPLKTGDRVEIYRPLPTSPKLLRKQRASRQRK